MNGYLCSDEGNFFKLVNAFDPLLTVTGEYKIMMVQIIRVVLYTNYKQGSNSILDNRTNQLPFLSVIPELSLCCYINVAMELIMIMLMLIIHHHNTCTHYYFIYLHAPPTCLLVY